MSIFKNKSKKLKRLRDSFQQGRNEIKFRGGSSKDFKKNYEIEMGAPFQIALTLIQKHIIVKN